MTAKVFLLRPVRESEVDMVYRWRNEPRVRAVMPYSDPIDLAAHRHWWPRALSDPGRRMLILEDENKPVATVVFIKAEWGFYTAPRSEINAASARSAWIACQVAAIRYGFDYLGLDELYCSTIVTNAAVLRLSDRTGFQTIMPTKPGFIDKKLHRNSRPDSPYPRLRLAIEPDPRDLRSTAHGCSQRVGERAGSFHLSFQGRPDPL